MTTFYEIAYRVGFTPWERAGEAGAAQLDELYAEVETGRPRPLGAALDIGCGTGTHAVDLARRGWQVTGLDQVEKALDRARRRPGAEAVTFVRGDATDLAASVTGPFDLVMDIGCFHGLDADQRAAYGRGLDAVAAPGATMLLLAFGPGAPRPLPRGVTDDDIAAALPGWRLRRKVPADQAGMPKPLRKLPTAFHVLDRVAG